MHDRCERRETPFTFTPGRLSSPCQLTNYTNHCITHAKRCRFHAVANHRTPHHLSPSSVSLLLITLTCVSNINYTKHRSPYAPCRPRRCPYQRPAFAPFLRSPVAVASSRFASTRHPFSICTHPARRPCTHSPVRRRCAAALSPLRCTILRCMHADSIRPR